MNVKTIRGFNCVIVVLPSISVRINYWSKELVPFGEKILFFKSRFHFGKLRPAGKPTEKSQKLFPFVKTAENHAGVPLHRKFCLYL